MLGDDHWRTVELIAGVAGFYRTQGRYEEAEPLLLEVLETRNRVFGRDNPNSIVAMNELAKLYRDQGRLDEAEKLYRETFDIRRRVQGVGHAATLDSMYDLACISALRGDQGSALDWLRQSVNVGYANADSMSQDPDLESLHGSDFDALVEQARQNAAAQRAD